MQLVEFHSTKLRLRRASNMFEQIGAGTPAISHQMLLIVNIKNSKISCLFQGQVTTRHTNPSNMSEMFRCWSHNTNVRMAIKHPRIKCFIQAIILFGII
jgi:hypothetical protein